MKADCPTCQRIAEQHIYDVRLYNAAVQRRDQAIALLRELRDSYMDLHQDREHEENCAGCERLRKADKLLEGGDGSA